MAMSDSERRQAAEEGRQRPSGKRGGVLRWLWLASVAGATVLYFVLPTSWPDFVYATVGALSVFLIVAGVRIFRPPRAYAWYLLAAGHAMTVLADIVFYLYEPVSGSPPPYPSFIDAIYLSLYPLTVAGLLLLVRGRSPGRDRAAMIDASIIATAGALLAWVFLIAPYATDAALTLPEKMVSIAYPCMDVLLLGVAARLVVASGFRGLSFVLLVSSFGLTLMANAAYGAMILSGSYKPGSLIDAGWLFSYGLVAASAIHPSMRRLSEAGSTTYTKLTRGRLVVLAVASLTAPVTLGIQAALGQPLETPVFVGSCVVLFLLVLMRVWGLVSSLLSERDIQRIFLEGVLENLDAGVVACDAEGTLTLFNRASREFHNLPAEPISSQEWAEHYDLYRADGVTQLPTAEIPLCRALDGEQVHDAEMVIAPRGGEPRTLLVNGHSLHGEQNVLLGAVVAMHDVTKLRKAEQIALSRQALHDSLTHLPNRLLLRDRLDHALVSGGRHSHSVVLLVLDLDGFKTVNDSLGRQVGDQVLIVIAERLRSTLRPGDTVARLEGDQFAVILEDMMKEQAVGIAAELDIIVREPVSVRGRSIAVAASIGITESEKGNSAEEMFRNADLAMRSAKCEGRVQVFEPSMHEAVLKRLTLDAELREAIAGHQFTLHYQPIVSLATGNLTGFEALIRWDHPDRGRVSPATFIPVAEATGLIVPLGEWVLRTACLQARRWQEANPETQDLQMHVNLSVRQLQSDSVVEIVGAALTDTRLSPDQLVLEITESAVMHRGESLVVLDRLHETGIHFAIDDFGTGYSSLDRLHSLPIDKVKIDKSIIDSVSNGSPAPLVAATIAMAHSLGLQTVAEGVERAEQLPFLRVHGCDQVQGYLFGRPTDAATIDEMLGDRNTESRWTDLDPREEAHRFHSVGEVTERTQEKGS